MGEEYEIKFFRQGTCSLGPSQCGNAVICILNQGSELLPDVAVRVDDDGLTVSIVCQNRAEFGDEEEEPPKQQYVPHNCAQCGKDMNPVEWILGSVCGKCCRLNQAKASGEASRVKEDSGG